MISPDARNIDTAALVKDWPVDWGSKPFCEAFLYGGNTGERHGGGSPLFFLLLTVTALVGVFSTGQTEPGSLARWSTSLPLLVAITTIQGVNPGKEGPMAPVDILDLVESYVYTCISLLMLAGRRVWP